MPKKIFSFAHWLAFVLITSATCSHSFAQNERGWTTNENDPNFPRKIVRIKTLILHPAPEPRPALKHRLIPSEFNLVEANAAVHYLRAMGFLEQKFAQQELDRFWKKASDDSIETGAPIHDFPPYNWQGMSAGLLPLEEVKKYLRLTDFQIAELEAARNARNFDLHRNIRTAESPFSILLSEVQQVRGLARDHSLRCRVAIAERRFDDAFAFLGQELAMAKHLSREPFFVSILVGAAIAGIGWEDALDLAQMPDSPNLYWAYSALERPFLPFSNAFSFENEALFYELKALREVDDQPRSKEYWNTFIDRILPQYNRLYSVLGQSQPESLDRLGLVTMIAAGYPRARQYLIESERMTSSLVDSLPMAQVFFLAQRKYCEYVLDEPFKLTRLEYSKVYPNERSQPDIEQKLREQASTVGWVAIPAETVTPSLTQILAAIHRIDLQIAMLQAIEAIRMYASNHDGKLPPSLADLPYPAPINPFTGQAFEYELRGEAATLTARAGLYVYVLHLQMAK